MAQDTWQIFDIETLKQRVQGPEPRFFEYLRSGRLSSALYRLPAGANDLQGPHLEDEIYIVLEGSARLRVGSDEQAVRPGQVLFIRANAAHAFIDIREDLTLLAVFSVPEKPYGT